MDANLAKTVQVALSKDGKIFLEGNETDFPRLEAQLQREAKIRPNMRITLSADSSLPYGKIAETMGKIKKAGVHQIALSVKR